ncbi:MAG: STAS domain-containing protein [Planctomycetota bacterium]|nr:MAG: STAS domain-containing protein [Planctomycetota bacterium]
MRIKRQDYKDVTVVELQGELDSDFTELLENNITEIVSAKRVGIVLDMSNVGFIDGQGLEKLLWARDYCNENTCQLRLAGLDENCAKILEVTQLDSQFERYAEVAEAVKSLV